MQHRPTQESTSITSIKYVLTKLHKIEMAGQMFCGFYHITFERNQFVCLRAVTADGLNDESNSRFS
jgi:hypothetical protein